MSTGWRHRIVRVPLDDEEHLRETVSAAVREGWTYEAKERGTEGMVDLVFRRARPSQPQAAWS